MLLWPFNKYPGTDYETYNWEWILKTVKEWVAKMQAFLDAINAGWDAMKQDWDDFKDHVYKDEIEEILAKHPEWTTTVQNGAITFQKLNGSIQAFTTPEAFGAVGDGVTDDTQAWQDAVDVGVTVIALSDTYKTGTINVTKNIKIDCNGAEFVCVDEKLFNCYGTVTNLTQNCPNYVKNKPYSYGGTYSGFGFIRSTDNIITTRNYYYGGFPAIFENGITKCNYPVSFVYVSVEEVDPIMCEICNIQGVEHINNPDRNYAVYCLYGHHCHFHHIHQDGEIYNIVTLENSLECEIDNITGQIDYNGVLTYYYAIEMLGSSECYTHDCDIISKWWHCWTTGGEFLNMNNVVERCNFYTLNGSGLADHDNAIGTTLRNCRISGQAQLYGNSVAENVEIIQGRISRNDGSQMCAIKFYYTNLEGCNNFKADNIKLVIESDNPPHNNTAYGIYVAGSAQTDDNDFYINDVEIKNLFATHYTNDLTIAINCNSSITNAIECTGNIRLDNVVGRLIINDADDKIDWTNCEMTISNCEKRGAEGFRPSTQTGTARPMKMTIKNSTLKNFPGVYTDLTLIGIKQADAGTVFQMSGTKLRAANIDRIETNSIKNFTDAQISAMHFSDKYLWVYAVNNADYSCYGRIETTGIVNYAL